ncbi:MAG TPA: hypothetical protein VE960_03770, partial [bacterium]|nr:hypothetical protein [bacterium]
GEGGGVSDCVFEANTAVYGGGVALQGGTPGMPVYGCTFALNSVTGQRGIGAGIAVDGISVPIAQNIIAFSTSGEAIGCEGGGEVTAHACAIYGNAGGDWVGCIASQESQSYNSDADPLFCDMYVGTFHLCENSYCHSSNNPSGIRIGALPPGCDACESPVEVESWGTIKAMYR